jgi:hypothetical protein
MATDVINVIPNFPYTFSFWARGKCGLFFGADAPNGFLVFSTSPGDLTDDSVWVRREIVRIVEIRSIRLVFGCGGQDSIQNLRLDAVSLVPTTGGCPLPVGF